MRAFLAALFVIMSGPLLAQSGGVGFSPAFRFLKAVRERDGTVVVEVDDDGVGLPEGFELAAGGGIGSRTIHVLAQQIDADIAYDSRATGLHFALRLPAADGQASRRLAPQPAAAS